MSSILNFDFSSVFPTEVIKYIAGKSGYNKPILEQWILDMHQKKININICKENFSNIQEKKIIKNIPDEFEESVQVRIPYSMCKKEFMTEILISCGFGISSIIDKDIINKYIMFCKMNNISNDYTEFILNIPLWDSTTDTSVEDKSINYIKLNDTFANVKYIIIDPGNIFKYSIEKLQGFKQDLREGLNIIKSLRYPDVEFNNVSQEDNEIATFISNNIKMGGFLIKNEGEIDGIRTLKSIFTEFIEVVNYDPYSWEIDVSQYKLKYNNDKKNICCIWLSP